MCGGDEQAHRRQTEGDMSGTGGDRHVEGVHRLLMVYWVQLITDALSSYHTINL